MTTILQNCHFGERPRCCYPGRRGCKQARVFGAILRVHAAGGQYSPGADMAYTVLTVG
jgi:hypothetical protein